MTVWAPAGRSPLRRLRRAGPEIVLGLIIVLSGLSVWQAWGLAGHVRDDARDASRVFGRIIAALSDPAPGGDAGLLLQIASDIRSTGIPLIVTDSSGRPTATANLPFAAGLDDPRVAAYARVLDRVNVPVSGPAYGQIHFGQLPVGRRLTWLALLQVGVLLTTIAVGVWAYRASIDRNRERLWVAVARESAHQLGTPLMSASAWIERLAEGGERAREIAGHLSADFERLQRVAQRFERIGRPARAERVALGALAERVAAYFQPRLPRHANPVTIAVEAPSAGPTVQGDPVLLEWAVEALVRNSVDALSGRGGTIRIAVAGGGESASVTVTDDGPGVAPEVRSTLFEPGVSTKQGGWGIGLPLARRIVEDVHGGSLALAPSAGGARFVASLPVGAG